METAKLKRFAQFARRNLIEQVSGKLKSVLAQDSSARRENLRAVQDLEKQIRETTKDQVIEKVAYTWFNRFCALRFMDVNRYTHIGVVSPAEGQFQPEILAEAKMGHIDEDMVPERARQQIFALLEGKAPSRDPQSEAYRLLVVAACNDFHKAMPYLFERISDYTELLMPDDLLSGNSILAYTREAMTPDACQDVEVIGWLYQFYISEKKDEVFEGLKKNKKITPENIPAATQLFTPHWIVRYLVENSLGRLWMLNRPKSRLIDQMDYYIKPEQSETDFLRIDKPEELNICDPACGSGHMLVYAFDLLYAIYEEEGYEPSEIPEIILTHNLYGIEIDERAGELAAFALTMKARAKQRRFFRKPIQPNICVLENIRLDDIELNDYMNFIGRDLFTIGLETTLHQFEEAENFGSLIRPVITDVENILRTLEAKNVSGQLFLYPTHVKILKALRQVDYLSPKYHVVIANPPYMGGKGMNGRLVEWAKDNYPDSKSDLFAMFIERGLEMVPKLCYSAMVTMQSWMFLSSYEKLRDRLLTQTSIKSMTHMANMVMGIAFGTSATVWKRGGNINEKGAFCYIEYEDIGEGNKPIEFPPKNERNKVAFNIPNCGWFYRAVADFKKIPGSPIAYWVSEKFYDCFKNNIATGDLIDLKAGMSTGDNTIFQRVWHEVSNSNIGFSISDIKETESNFIKWYPCHSGGEYRKWYGNHDFVVNWQNNGHEIRTFGLNNGKIRSAVRNDSFYFKSGITWSKISSGRFAARWRPSGFLFDDTGRSGFSYDNERIMLALGIFCSCLSHEFLKVLCPTISFTSGELAKIPFANVTSKEAVKAISCMIAVGNRDWDSYETSWDFTSLPILHPVYHLPTLNAAYTQLRSHWREMTIEMQRLEEENNRIFLTAYGLQDELTPEVPLNEITLTCNPHYRYGGVKSDDELEALLLADTMKEFISYAVGCMFGRYALDKPGLILANRGETIDDYLKQIPEPTFPADNDNVIPILNGDWFIDDISERFHKFLRVTFGEEHYEANLKFIENALGKDIRKYFIKDFYNDHVKRYKKRPIYWLFSSSKGSFNALIYLHRYRPDTVSVVLNDYLREFRTKLTSRKTHLEAVSISGNASQGEKTKAINEIENLKKMIDELAEYERDVLYPLATEQVEIDLDDGVKVNYQTLGAALKKIPGLDSKEE